jgi:hypothetical protein
MNALQRFLFGPPRLSLWLHSTIAALLALIASTSTIFIAYSLAVLLDLDKKIIRPVTPDPSSLLNIFNGIIFTPALETFFLIGGVEILLRKKFTSFQTCIIIALFAGSLHSLFNWFWIFGVFWSFFIFTSCYIVWHQKTELKGFFAAFLPHSINNAVSYFSISLS